ncbi:MAG: metallophosphoesterase family protein [Chitinophagaceae bacterium]
MKTFVIGDIHGGLRALKQVLEIAEVSNDDTLIFLGDYVDGWSESAQTIQFLIKLSQQQNCIFIKGNHDEWCEEWLRSGRGDGVWLFHGGRETLNSYENFDESVKQTHLTFFEAMKSFFIDEKNRLFVHAGFTSMHGPLKEKHASNFSWDRTLWEVAITTSKTLKKTSLFYPKRLKLFEEIYIGHTPTIYYDQTVPMNGCNVWNVDTGAAFTGSLTIMDIDTKAYWQSDPVHELYQGEKGRNSD